MAPGINLFHTVELYHYIVNKLLNYKEIILVGLTLGAYRVRQCVSVTFLKSGVFSGKFDPEPGNFGPEFPVDFCSRLYYRQGFPFGITKMVQMVQNPCPKFN